ncbi:helix-turn-helix transcriptional regulator [uncultured Microscilla sp.]|uniref:helix-turn-helix domain-containing protein n=1 Tax=uncultured Microscilla sp. TaxID=432653 RepID=UPI00262627A8|nr:helix-turn-helix transcriptional regulator [uncultured Microscilla sp.]
MSLGERLKEARKNKKISQQALAEIAKVHYTNIGRYERGDAKPSSEVLNKLAQALDVSPDFLMNGTVQDKAHLYIKSEELLTKFKKIEQMPEDKKRLLMEFLDAFIFKVEIQQKLT